MWKCCFGRSGSVVQKKWAPGPPSGPRGKFSSIPVSRMPMVVRATPTVESNLMLGEKGSWGHHHSLKCFTGQGRVPEWYSLYPSAPSPFRSKAGRHAYGLSLKQWPKKSDLPHSSPNTLEKSHTLFIQELQWKAKQSELSSSQSGLRAGSISLGLHAV